MSTQVERFTLLKKAGFADVDKWKEFGEEYQQQLLGVVRNDPQTIELNLCWCGIGDANAEVLAGHLNKNTHLARLNLGWNELSDTGVKPIARALANHPTLIVLNLYDNKGITDASRPVLAYLLRTHPTLEYLNLSLTSITAKGRTVLAAALGRTELGDLHIKITAEERARAAQQRAKEAEARRATEARIRRDVETKVREELAREHEEHLANIPNRSRSTDVSDASPELLHGELSNVLSRLQNLASSDLSHRSAFLSSLMTLASAEACKPSTDALHQCAALADVTSLVDQLIPLEEEQAAIVRNATESARDRQHSSVMYNQFLAATGSPAESPPIDLWQQARQQQQAAVTSLQKLHQHYLTRAQHQQHYLAAAANISATNHADPAATTVLQLSRDAHTTLDQAKATLQPLFAKTNLHLELLLQALQEEHAAVSEWLPKLTQAAETCKSVSAHQAKKLRLERPMEDARSTNVTLLQANQQLACLNELETMRAQVDALIQSGKLRALQEKKKQLEEQLEDVDYEIDKAPKRKRASELPYLQGKRTKLQEELATIYVELSIAAAAANHASFQRHFPQLCRQLQGSGASTRPLRIAHTLLREDLSLDMFTFVSDLVKLQDGRRVSHHQHDGRDIIIKQLPVERREFERECRRLEALKHPNVVDLHAVFFSGASLACMVMPFYKNGNLRPWVKEHAGVASAHAEVVSMMRQIFMAVGFIHQRGIIHCDLKPENILLADDGRPVLCDFGSSRDFHARFQTSATTVGMLGGTEPYAAPEAREVGGWRKCPTAVDAWSLGIMLLELIEGELHGWNPGFRAVTNGAGKQIELDQRRGAGWELVRRLLCAQPQQRLTVHEALLSDYFSGQQREAEVEGQLVAAYNSLQSTLTALRLSNEPSLLLTLHGKAGSAVIDWQRFMHDVREVDHKRIWRVMLEEEEAKPLAEVMTSVTSWLLDPSNGFAETVGNGFVVPQQNCDVWHAFGQLLAKCVMEQISAPIEKLALSVLRFVAHGELPRKLETLLNMARQLQPAKVEEWERDITTAVDRSVAREKVRAEAMDLLMGGRKEVWGKLRDGFWSAFAWGDGLKTYFQHGGDVSLLLADDGAVEVEKILNCLRLIEHADQDHQRHLDWVKSYLRTSNSVVLRQFVTRCLNKMILEGGEDKNIVVIVDCTKHVVEFLPTLPGIVVPHCENEAELRQYLHRALSRHSEDVRDCVACLGQFAVQDGLLCGGGEQHFVCSECSDTQIKELCGRNAAELAQLENIAGCSMCKVAFEDRNLAQRLPPATFAALLKAREAAVQYHVEHRLEKQFDRRVQTEAARLAALSAEEREIRRHVQHIVDELLTLHCPRAGCRQAFVDFEGCFALKCSRCKAGFCAKCLVDCGSDAHAHIAQCNQGGQLGNLQQLHGFWRQRRQKAVTDYLQTIGDQGLRRKVLAQCQPHLRGLGVVVAGDRGEGGF